MTNLDHDRPILKMIDAMKRERQRLISASAAPTGNLDVRTAMKKLAPVRLKRDRELIHESAVSVLTHFAQHFDLRVLHRFMEAVGDARHQVALTAWFTRYGPISVGTDGKFRTSRDKRAALAEAKLDPFWNYQPKSEPKPFNPIADLERIERRLSKAGTAHIKLLSDLRSLLKQHRA